jgi:E3 ubiquitin-protein ligase synoviolin
LVNVISTFIRYILHAIDIQNESPWENKGIYMLYGDLVLGFFRVILYLTFMTLMIKIHTFPLFAIRPMYLSLRSFKKSLNDVIMSRRAIRNLNNMYPDVTVEQLRNYSDTICIICREEMTSPNDSPVQQIKKLPCDHIFHKSCLRSWFQRQQTCPTCRTSILRFTYPNQEQNMPQQQQQQQQQPPQQPQNNLGGGVGNQNNNQTPHQTPSQSPQRNENTFRPFSNTRFMFNNNNNNNNNTINNQSSPNINHQFGFLPPFGII